MIIDYFYGFLLLRHWSGQVLIIDYWIENSNDKIGKESIMYFSSILPPSLSFKTRLPRMQSYGGQAMLDA